MDTKTTTTTVNYPNLTPTAPLVGYTNMNPQPVMAQPIIVTTEHRGICDDTRKIGLLAFFVIEIDLYTLHAHIQCATILPYYSLIMPKGHFSHRKVPRTWARTYTVLVAYDLTLYVLQDHDFSISVDFFTCVSPPLTLCYTN